MKRVLNISLFWNMTESLYKYKLLWLNSRGKKNYSFVSYNPARSFLNLKGFFFALSLKALVSVIKSHPVT